MGFQALNAYSLLDTLWNSGCSTVWGHCFWQVWYINCTRNNNFYSAASPQNHRAGLRKKERIKEKKFWPRKPVDHVAGWAHVTLRLDTAVVVGVLSGHTRRRTAAITVTTPAGFQRLTCQGHHATLHQKHVGIILDELHTQQQKVLRPNNLRDWKKYLKQKQKQNIETNGKTTTDWVAGIRWSFKQTNKNTNKQKSHEKCFG